MLLHLFKHNLGCSKCSLCRLSVVILETNNATQPSGVYAQELKKRNIITRLHLWKKNLGCSKCRLCHLPVGFVGTKNATQPSGVYAKDLKKKRELRVYLFKNIIWDVLSVVSATYLWASWKPRIQLSQVESSLCTSPQDKVDKELDGQEEIGFSFGWNSVYI